jgi:hypothetical protein
MVLAGDTDGDGQVRLGHVPSYHIGAILHGSHGKYQGLPGCFFVGRIDEKYIQLPYHWLVYSFFILMDLALHWLQLFLYLQINYAEFARMMKANGKEEPLFMEDFRCVHWSSLLLWPRLRVI